MKTSKSSKAWLHRQESDPYVRRAKSEGYRSRAAFKLLEIDERDRLIKPGMTVVDLGAAPGGWSQVAAEKVGAQGQVFALDLLDMQPIRGVTFIRGDIADPKIVAELRQAVEGRSVDLVLSDMAPNISGIGHADSSRGIELAQLALAISTMILKHGGSFLVKFFEGAESREFRDELNTCFKEVVTRKPRASRDRSREIYLLGRNFKGGTIGLSSAHSISQENR
ncbi:MAG: RlmE family RNA methyltransferase [Burkholderiales bacterium]